LLSQGYAGAVQDRQDYEAPLRIVEAVAAVKETRSAAWREKQSTFSAVTCA
jgi:hypothetical protein